MPVTHQYIDGIFISIAAFRFSICGCREGIVSTVLSLSRHYNHTGVSDICSLVSIRLASGKYTNLQKRNKKLMRCAYYNITHAMLAVNLFTDRLVNRLQILHSSKKICNLSNEKPLSSVLLSYFLAYITSSKSA